MEGEIVAKIDISAKILTIVRVLEKTSFDQTRYPLSRRNGITISMAAGVDGEVVAVSVPLKVCPELLDGDLAGETGLEKIRGFFMMGDARW